MITIWFFELKKKTYLFLNLNGSRQKRGKNKFKIKIGRKFFRHFCFLVSKIKINQQTLTVSFCRQMAIKSGQIYGHDCVRPG